MRWCLDGVYRTVSKPMMIRSLTISAVSSAAASMRLPRPRADDRQVTVAKFLKEKSGKDEEPVGTAVDAAILGIDLLCSAELNADKSATSTEVNECAG